MNSVDAAQSWREANAPERAKRNAKAITPVQTTPVITEATVPESGHSIDGTNDEGDRGEDRPDNPYDALREAKGAERDAMQRLKRMQKTADQVDVDRAQRTFTLAQRHRIWMTTQVRAWAREKGIILYADEAKLLYGNALQALTRLINVMPKALAARCSSPQMAEMAIAEYVERIRKAMQADLAEAISK
jgi:hypothetical protein